MRWYGTSGGVIYKIQGESAGRPSKIEQLGMKVERIQSEVEK